MTASVNTVVGSAVLVAIAVSSSVGIGGRIAILEV
jgi:hypothetical protein